MTRKKNLPTILTVDDGHVFNRHNSAMSSYAFVFSSDIEDWIRSRRKRDNDANPDRWKQWNRKNSLTFKQKHG